MNNNIIKLVKLMPEASIRVEDNANSTIIASIVLKDKTIAEIHLETERPTVLNDNIKVIPTDDEDISFFDSMEHAMTDVDTQLAIHNSRYKDDISDEFKDWIDINDI